MLFLEFKGIFWNYTVWSLHCLVKIPGVNYHKLQAATQAMKNTTALYHRNSAET